MSTQQQYFLDVEQVYKWWSVFHEEGEVCEVRCIDANKVAPILSGYYKNVDNIIRDISKVSLDERYQIYFVLNKIKDECYDRKQCEHIMSKAANTTNDKDIEGIKWIFLDFDANHSAGIGSTDAQVELAKQKAHEVCKFLRDNGFSKPVVGMSGNGFHTFLRVNLANNEESEQLIKRFTSALGMLFSDDNIKIDPAVKNAARLAKIFGSMARKGRNSKERPWRYSKLIQIPDEIIPNDKAYIQKIADMFPDEKPAPTRENNFGKEPFDIVSFLDKHGLEYRTVSTGLGTRYILKECPFDSTHHDPDSMVFQHTNGALEFKCFHSSCDHYHWKEFRLHFEPDAYDKKDYQEFRSKQRYYEKYTVPQEPEIKKETDELGKKWLTLRDIKLTKDSERFSIKTGIYALDKAIGGLFEDETTLLSGINASGKTAILNQIILNAAQRDVPSGLWSGELPAQRIKSWICQTAAGKQNVTKVEGRDNAYEVNENVIEKIENWIDKRLVIYNNNYGSNSEQILADVEEAIKKYGLKLVLLDNLMALSLDDLVGTMNEKQKALMVKLDALAKKYHIHILIIAHPRKEANFQLLRKESISGTSDLTNIVWNVLLIHRVGDDFEKRATEFWGKERTNKLILEGYNNIIEVAKNRDYGVVDFVVGLFYEIETKRFKNYKAEQIHYDWEEQVEEYTYTAPTSQTFAPNPEFEKNAAAPESIVLGPTVTPTFDNDDTYWAQFKHDSSPLPF